MRRRFNPARIISSKRRLRHALFKPDYFPLALPLMLVFFLLFVGLIALIEVGSLGTLIGTDLLSLGKIRGLGAPVASFGGPAPSTGFS